VETKTRGPKNREKEVVEKGCEVSCLDPAEEPPRIFLPPKPKTPFDNNESHAHETAKKLLCEWLCTGGMDFYTHYDSYLIPACRDTGVVCLMEYPLYRDSRLNQGFRDEFCGVWDDPRYACWRLGGEAPCMECVRPRELTEKTVWTAVLDIAFGYKGRMDCAIEVEHKNELTQEKSDIIRQEGMTVIEIRAETILAQLVGKRPARLRAEGIWTP
jgi:hypothetical protein